MAKAENGSEHVPRALSDILKGTDYALTIFTNAEIRALNVFDKGGKPYLKCWATDKERPAKPEEIVRQLYINKLMQHYGYPKDRLQIEKAIDYWSAVSNVMPDWIKVKNGQLMSVDLRQERISSHTVVLRAIGGVGAELMQLPNWRERVGDFGKIDWSKKNPEWQNLCIVANSVVSNRQSRAATKAYIKRQLGLHLSDAEIRLLDGVKAKDPAGLTA